MRRRVVLVGGCVLLVLAVLASLAIGSNPLSPISVWRGLWAPDGGTASTIVWDLRMPRTLLGVVVGAALATSGVLLQALTRNPLAEPRVLGISAGAALGVVGAITLFDIGTLAGYVVRHRRRVRCRSARVRRRRPYAGQRVAGHADARRRGARRDPRRGDRRSAQRRREHLRGVPVLGRGRAHRSRRGHRRAGPAVPARRAVAGRGGRTGSGRVGARRRRGPRPRRAGRCDADRGGAAAVLLTGAGVAAAGPIAFVGLAVPHFARFLVGSDQRWVLGISVLLGPTLLLVADVIGRLITPGEVSAGIVTALLGAPLLAVLVQRARTVAA